MKHYINRDSNYTHKCLEPCKYINKGISDNLQKNIGVMIGSGYCQKCEHHKNNNLIESIGKDYSITKNGGSLVWIECDKIS